MPVSQQKLLGAWYTPADLVAAVVQHTITPSTRTVLDPACGDGRFLAAAREAGAREVTGIDVDSGAAVFASPPMAGRYVHADALALELPEASFDAVVGNPPFLNQLAAATTRGGSSRFGGGPYADAAAEFLALAIRLVRPGGRVGLVLPLSLLSSRDAAAIRAAVDAQAALRWMWWSPQPVFDAHVRTWAGVWEVGGAPGAVERSFGPDFTPIDQIAMPSSWSGLIADSERPEPPSAGTLGDIATFTADFRDQYYGLIGAVGDEVDGPPLITSGLIDPDECRWGMRPVRFAKQQYRAPRVALDRLSPALRKWANLRLVPKILIANQTKVIEAVADVDGAWLPSVPVITCASEDLPRVHAVLRSPAATSWVRYHAAGSGLSATSVRLTPALLASIPLPA